MILVSPRRRTPLEPSCTCRTHREIMPEYRSHGCSEFRGLRAISRRAVLQAGAVGSLGLTLPTLRNRSAMGSDAGPGFGSARRCILLFMWGGPSQLDTFDMKPDAPSEIRGEFRPVSTSVPGFRICEHFERLGPLMDRVAVVRSLTHDDPAHLSSAHTILTGHLPPVNKSDDEPPSERDTPHVGSVVARLQPAAAGLPPFVMMPWQTFHPSAPGGTAPGQHGGWLGRTFDPFLIGGDPSKPDWNVPALSLLDGVSSGRLLQRQRFLSEVDAQRRSLDSLATVRDLDDQQQKAFDLLVSPNVRSAFDVSQEPDEVRERYGQNIHGQCVLLARRLVEHGVNLVTVNWHNDGHNFWDTHGNNFKRLRKDLIPPADRALAALLTDLEQGGLLDETIIAWVGEFGRRPQITRNNAGREHHPFCYSGLLAGGGIRGGAVYGQSDARAEHPEESPVSPHDFNATLMHALGIGAETTLPDRTGRPVRLYGGRPIEPLFG
jgi:hypothetical protein